MRAAARAAAINDPMTSLNIRRPAAWAFALLTVAALAWFTRFLPAQAAESPSAEAEAAFQRDVKPFFEKHCVQCHNADANIAGVRVDHLDASMADHTVHLWEGIRRRMANDTMPPKELPRPDDAERRRAVAWMEQTLEVARLRPTPKNGVVRRLTVAQYRNTLQELLQIDDDLTEALPPDAVSKDGFVNNTETLQLSPLLMEAYFEIAEEALNRAIVDPDSPPSIQNFRMDLGAAINSDPLPEQLILGANSLLLENPDFVVTQLIPKKPFVFEPYFMKTQYRFIEGYQGNDTVRGWRDYDSIYHAVFACMRGSRGYPKGLPYSAAPEGLLLRPAIPTDELFGSDGTYGPKANFKIALRELPDYGPFRVTVTAAKYNDGLLLDEGDEARSDSVALVARKPKDGATVRVRQPGVYQVDIHTADADPQIAAPDGSRLSEGLAGHWPLEGEDSAQLQGAAAPTPSPFGRAVSLDSPGDAVTSASGESLNIGEGDFTVSAWIRPTVLKRAGIVARGGYDWTHGWYLDMPDNKGVLRLETFRADQESNGVVASQPGVIVEGAWQHVAAVVRRGKEGTRLYVNGYPVAKGDIGPADLDNANLDLHMGRIPAGPQFRGDIDEVRLYRRALDEAELQALVEPGRRFALPPPEKPQDVRLSLGGRQFSGKLERPAFLAVRLEAGELPVRAEYDGVLELDRIVLTPLPDANPLAKRFSTFEKRSPRLGVHVGLRRDCGHSFGPVGEPQSVSNGSLERFVFEGAIANFPNPHVEADNVNYLAGVREIAVRSEYTDGRDMPRLAIKSVEFEGPYYETWPPPSHAAIFIDSPRKDDPPAYAREVLRSFAARAYRRPPSTEEVAALASVFDKSFAEGRGFRNSVKDALQVALTSPQFLFLVENSLSPAPEPLDDYELASKLSYFLWNGLPDAQTLKLAASGRLRDSLDAEVDRLIDDRRFSRFASEFVSQWLSLDKLDVLEPDREKFPKLTREARTELRREPIELVQHLIRQNLPARNLVDSELILANEVVADYYGFPEMTESGFELAPIVHGRPELGGLLTQAAILAGLSDGRESNPVKRGAWVARKIVAEPPNDPPPNVPALDEETEGLTLRQRLEQHRNQPGCMQCHLKIDPWGVPFEEFDAAGRLKTEPVDARSTLPDETEVAGVNELKHYLADDRIDQVAFSVLKHLVTYANGRSLSYSETHALKNDAKALRAGGYRMRDMVRYVVRSDLFLEK